MKIVAIGDLHGYWSKTFESKIRRAKPDIILQTGDVQAAPIHLKEFKALDKNMNELTDKETTLLTELYVIYQREQLKNLASFGVPVYLLWGDVGRSSEREITLPYECTKVDNLNYVGSKIVKLNGISIFGFEQYYEDYMIFTESKRRGVEMGRIKMLTDEIRQKYISALAKAKQPLIILSHNAPYGYLDQLGNHLSKELAGRHVGSQFLKQCINMYEPTLVICSHVHEAKGVAEIKGTKVVNCGDKGSFAVISIDGGINIELF